MSHMVLPEAAVLVRSLSGNELSAIRRVARSLRVDDGGPISMKVTPWYVAALLPFAAVGYSGVYLAHATVVGLTIAIFCGTLALNRSPAPPAPVAK